MRKRNNRDYIHKGARTKNGCKVCGKLKVEFTREQLRAGKPREGGSARLSEEDTYKEEIHMLWCVNKRVIRCRTEFCSGLLDFPPLIA